MKSFDLSLEPSLSEREADRVLAKIRELPDVDGAGLLSPHMPNASASSIGYVKLMPSSDAAATARAVSDLPGVASCRVPAARYAL